MRNPEIEERASITFDFDALLIKRFGGLHVALFELLGALFQEVYSSHLCGVRRSRVRGRRRSPSWIGAGGII